MQQTEATLRNYMVDPAHSNVRFAVRHMLISKVRGTFSVTSGQLVLPANSFIPLSVTITMEASTIDTREQQRDAHLRSADFLDAENFPIIRFTSEHITPIDLDSFEAIGDLELRGMRRTVVIRAAVAGFGKDPWGNDRIAYEATFTINRSAWGLTWNQALEAGGFVVGDEIEVAVDVETVPRTQV